jgi:hypothetical protein
MKVKLEESHTTIVTNCNLLSAGKFPPKVMQRKNARENARACDVTVVTKIITSGRIKYESLENSTEKISQVDLCAEPIKQLKPRTSYHMTALQTLMPRIILKMMLKNK